MAQPGLQKQLGNGVKPSRGTGGPSGDLQAGTELGRPAKGTFMTRRGDKDTAWGCSQQAAALLAVLLSQPLYIPLPKTTARKLPAVSAPVTSPQSTWFAASQGTWVFFPLI